MMEKRLHANLMDGFGFDPVWTLAEAQEAQDKSSEEHTSPFSPLMRWFAWHTLNECKDRYEKGNKEVLLSALQRCAAHDLPMPVWVADAYAKSFHLWVNYKVASLDEAFEVTIPKGKHLSTLRELRTLKIQVDMAVEELRKKGEPKGEDFFIAVGKLCQPQIGGSRAKGIYYGSRKMETSAKNKIS